MSKNDLFDIPSDVNREVSDAAKILQSFISRVEGDSSESVGGQLFSQQHLETPLTESDIFSNAGMNAAEEILNNKVEKSLEDIQSGTPFTPSRENHEKIKESQGAPVIGEVSRQPLSTEAQNQLENLVNVSSLDFEETPSLAPVEKKEEIQEEKKEPEKPSTESQDLQRVRSFEFAAPVELEEEDMPVLLEATAKEVVIEPVVKKSPVQPPQIEEAFFESPPQEKKRETPKAKNATVSSANQDVDQLWFSQDSLSAAPVSSGYVPSYPSDLDFDYYEQTNDKRKEGLKTFLVVGSVALITLLVVIMVGNSLKKDNKQAKNNVVVNNTPPQPKKNLLVVDSKKVAIPIASTSPTTTAPVQVAKQDAKELVSDSSKPKKQEPVVPLDAKQTVSAQQEKKEEKKPVQVVEKKKKKKTRLTKKKKKKKVSPVVVKKKKKKKVRVAKKEEPVVKKEEPVVKKEEPVVKPVKVATAQYDIQKSKELYEQGRAMFLNNKIGPAQTFIVRAIRANPNNAECYRVLGLIYYRLQKNTLAKRAFNRYLKLQPTGQLSVQVKALLSTL